MGKNRPILFEVLEPRILLSGDGLLNATIPDQDQDTLHNGVQQVVQYNELLDIKEQVEEQISQELVPSEAPNIGDYQPVFTLLVVDDNTNDELVNGDLSADHIESAQVNGEIAVILNDSDERVESKVSKTKDENPQVYVNDNEVSTEEISSIEIRGPPLNECVNIDSEDAEVDHTILDEYATKSQADGSVNLPGLVLVDPDLTNIEGQIVYLDFDGEENINYSGPVLVEGINVPEFALPVSLAGQEEVVITHIVEELERIFAGSGVIFTIETPNSTQPYSTVYIGGDYSAFAEYGSFLGLAEQVDIGNQNLCDNAFVFSETFVDEYKNANTLATHLADLIAHEVGHLLGYVHEHQVTEGSVLSDVAWTQLTGDTALWPYADGPNEETVSLPHSVYRMGTTVGIYEGQTAIFSVGGCSFRAGVFLDYSRDAPGTEPKYWGNRQSHFSIYFPDSDTWISADGTDDIDNGDGTWTSVGLTGYNNGNGINSPLVEQGTGVIMDQCFYNDGAVYVFGGYPPMRSGPMAKYDIATNSWSQVTLGDDYGPYGGGGLIGSHWYKVHKEGFLMDYDVSTDTFGPDIPFDGLKDPQFGTVSGVIGDKLYIVDTYDADVPGMVYEIDPLARTIVEMSPAPTPVIEAGTVVHNGRLYLLGGRTESTPDSAIDTIQVYDPVLDKWWISPDKLPVQGSGFLAEIVGDTLYIGNGINSLPGDDTAVLNDLWCSHIPTIPEPSLELWMASYNGPSNSLDNANAIAVGNSGHIYVTGFADEWWFDGDYCTIAYDNEGNELWVAGYNGPGNALDYANAIAVDENDRIYVTGRSKGLGTGYDYCTIAYDSEGNELWVNRYDGPGTGDDVAHAIAVGVSGHVYVTGITDWSDYYTVAYDNQGHELWADRYNSGSRDSAEAIAVGGKGQVYVTGSSSTIAYDVQGNRLWVAGRGGNAVATDNNGHIYVTGGSSNYSTTAYDSQGNELWTAVYNGPADGDDQANAIVTDDAGQIYVTGESEGIGTDDDYCTVAYDSEGNELWVARYDGPISGNDYVTAIAADNSGHVYVTGHCEVETRVGTEYDYCTIAYDTEGYELWVRLYDGPADDYLIPVDRAYAIAVDSRGDVYVTGGCYFVEGIGDDFCTIKYKGYPPVEGYGDLVVTAVDVQVPAMAGRPLHVAWDVLNADSNNTVAGGFIDAIYLSSDTEWNFSDIRLATVQREQPVGPQQTYHVEKDVILPGVLPADYYIIIRTDPLNQVEELDDENNIQVSDPIQIGVEELLVSSQIDDEFTVLEQARYYRITVDENKDLKIKLDDLDNAGANELYVSFEAMPTRSQFDYRYPTNFAADQTIRIPTQAGTYYILAYAGSVPAAQPSEYAIEANYLPFEITEVTPDRSGNTEFSTPSLTIEGSGFQPRCEVVLRRDGEADIVPTEVTWHNTGTIFARFDLQGVSAGVWDLVVANPDSQRVSFPFSIIDRAEGELNAHLILPDVLGYHIRSTIWIEYTNVGDGPMPAPLLKLHGGQDALLTVDEVMDGPGLWTSDPPKGLSDTVQVLASGTDADPAILNPGESGRIPVYFRGCKEPWDWSYPPIEFELGVLTHEDTTPIDFEQVEADIRPNPEDISPELWSVIWPQVQEQMGPTWGSYLRNLQENSGYLTAYGKETYSVHDLFAMEIAKATNAFVPPRTLAASVDAYCPAPGLSLVFGRAATDSIVHRFELGPLGRGWSHSFEYFLKRPDGVTAVIEGPGGTARTFTRVYPNIEAPWRASPGDYGLLREKTDGTFTLREKEGLTWTFDSAGHLVSLEEPNGNRITLSYLGDSLTQISHTNGLAFGLEYNSDGRIAALSDHAGLQTRYIYDQSGEYLVRVIAPGDRVTAYEYNMTAGGPASHALRSVTFPDGTHIYYNYDDRGRLKEQYRDGGAERIEFDYEDFNSLSIRDAYSAEASLNFGMPGQMADVVNPLGNSVSFDYNREGAFTGMVAPDGSAYELTYDDRGNVIRMEDSLGHTVSMDYSDLYNQLSYLTDQNGNRTDFATDTYGNLTSTAYPDSSTEQYEYDGAGNIIRYTNRRGQTINYTYDDYGRLIEKQYPDGQSVTYAYDAVGRLTEATDDSGTISLEYDDRGFLTRIEYPDGHWFTFAYNDGGQRTQRVGDDGYILNYYYDEAGRLKRLTDGDGTEIVVYTYDEIGRLIREDKGNGTYTTYEYDSASQALSPVNYSPTSEVQSRFDYTYDENGNRTSMTTLEGTTYYEYDALGQLIGVTYPDGRQVRYDYDPAGNRIAVTDGAETAYTTNNMNQYIQVGDATYTYDADGNMTSKTDNTGTSTYEYDEENRLVRVVAPSGETWEYTYDAFGNRVAVSHNGSVARYVHDPIDLVDIASEYSDLGTLMARYTHGLGLVARIDSGGNTAYYAFDVLGNTSQMTDSSGELANWYQYDAFGTIISGSETIHNPYKYIGEQGVLCEGNGLVFMRARYYDCGVGRFIQEDPIDILGGTNLYAYTCNNPVNGTDPSGLSSTEKLSIRQGREPEGLIDIIADSQAHRFAIMETLIYGDIVLDPQGRIPIPYTDNVFEEAYRQDYKQRAELANAFTANLWPFILSYPLGFFSQYSTALTQIIVQGSQAIYGIASAILTPNPPASSLDTQSRGTTQLHDPNDKIGAHGFGGDQFITPDSSMIYTIYFENESDATAAAKQVRIVDELDPDLDWTSFELLGIGFGPHQITVPSGMTHYDTSLEIDGWTYSEQEGWHTGETPLVVDIDADIDITTGQLTWNITSSDPETGWEPQDPYAGFLPPDDPDDVNHRGEGYVTFLIRPKADLPTGTQITNTASIYFDANPAIDTPEVLNTIDAGAPASAVLPLADRQTTTDFVVSWSGSDDTGGSGIREYEIYVSDKDSPYTLWTTTSETSVTFTGEDQHQYAFYSIAHDNVGHVEEPPEYPDATTTVILNQPPVVDIGPDTTVDEGEVLLRTCSFMDPDPCDSWTATVDYGDGTGEQPLPLDGQTFELNHVYADDGDYTVVVTVTDSYEESDSDQLTVTVLNAAPTVEAGPDQIINEGQVVALAPAIFNDLGTFDTHTAMVDWGDGTAPEPVVITESPFGPPGSTSGADGTIAGSHLYADNGIHMVAVIVTDDNGGSGSASFIVTINNVAPEITEFSSDATLSNKGSENEVVTVFASFVDIGKLDTHTAEIHWGDGVVTQGTVTESAGVGTVSASHAYAFGGIYTITLILEDDDSGVAQVTTTAVITGIGVQNGQLQVIGTDGKDKVSINLVGGKHHGDNHKGKSKKQYVRVHANFLPKVHSGDGDNEDYDGGSRFRDFDADAVSSILMILCDGDDHSKIAGNIAIDAIVDGGHGRDKLKGGAGNDIVLGGAGNDEIQGGSGADILIGGLGSDRLVGNRGDDILIGDTTVYDSDQAEDEFADVEALLAILDEWTSEKSFTERRDNISGENPSDDRLNDGFFLAPGVTVWDDGERDKLTGSSGEDWFILSGKDKAIDLHKNHDDNDRSCHHFI